ncbi:MAG TPA: hypothetical protein VIL05_10755 [Thermoclostridium sp.]
MVPNLTEISGQNKIDPGFNDMEIIKRFTKYTHVVRLSNVKVSGNLSNNHFSALPSLKPADGWAPIKNYMTQIFRISRNVKVMFEHRSDLISDEELNSCYSWIGSMQKNNTP